MVARCSLVVARFSLLVARLLFARYLILASQTSIDCGLLTVDYLLPHRIDDTEAHIAKCSRVAGGYDGFVHITGIENTGFEVFT
jgi:hypothetical protein